MTDVLDKIDASLEEVEEQLLTEFHRVMDAGSDDGLAHMDVGIRTALAEVTDMLHHELEHSGAGTLSLVTERHEILYSRIAVLRYLFTARIRITQLLETREGIATRRKRLENLVLAERQKRDGAAAEQKKPGLLSGIKGIFDHKPTEQEAERNAINVTSVEEQRLGQSQLYLDNGIFSASRELAMIASLTRGGTLDRPPEEADGQDSPTPAGKARFESKDLSYHAPPTERINRPAPEPKAKPAPTPEISRRDIAQTPEEIRRKLAARREAAKAGPASFEAKDLASSTYNEPPRPRQKPTAASENKPEPRSGPAVFESRDLSSATYSEPPRPRQRESEPPADKPGQSGRAVFAAKDIDPVVPSDPPRRRKKDEEDEKKDEPRKGPAVFEARDLSNAPFPKKD